MGTQFTEIYEQNEIIRDDKRIKNKPTNLVYKLYYNYLKFSVGKFYRDCYKNLKNHIPFSQTEYMFNCDGVSNQFLLISPSIPSDNSRFYVGYAKDKNTPYTEVTSDNYTYDNTTNVLSIHDLSIPFIPSGYVVYISSYAIGEFTDDLDIDEILILVEGMLIPYQQEQQNRNSLLTQMVYGGGQKMSSQAEHMKQVHTIVKDQEDKVGIMIKEYSYSANPQNLIKLGGGN